MIVVVAAALYIYDASLQPRKMLAPLGQNVPGCHFVMMQLCDSSRSAGEWAVAEAALTTLVSAALGNETICRRLLRVGLDQLIDAAEDNDNAAYGSDHSKQQQITNGGKGGPGGLENARQHHRSKAVVRDAPFPSRADVVGKSAKKKHNNLLVMPGTASALPPPRSLPPIVGSPQRGPATDGELGLDQIDEIGVDGVLQESSDALALRMQGESRETCSALAMSLLQTLGPFNYVSCLSSAFCRCRRMHLQRCKRFKLAPSPHASDSKFCVGRAKTGVHAGSPCGSSLTVEGPGMLIGVHI